MNSCLVELLSPLSVQIDEGVDKVGDARAYVEEVDQLIVEVEVKGIWHVPMYLSIAIE